MYSNMLWRRLPSPSITPNELLEILTAHTAGYYVLPTEPNDEVYPGIYVGDSTTALCLHLLRRLGITHVLNAAWGKQRNLGMVNTSAAYYRNSGIEFFGIEALDIAVFPLFQHFPAAIEFIDGALRDNGKVLVHCGEGISRSSTLVLAYLMVKRGMRVQDAVRQVVKNRNILPNQGFLLQLCQLHDQLQSCSLPPSPSPSPSTVRSSVSPFRDSTTSMSSQISKPLYSHSSLEDKPRNVLTRCPSPSPAARVWSNGWNPPPRSSSPASKYVSSYSSKYSKSFEISPSRSRRCQSVDREFGSGSFYNNDSSNSRSNHYGSNRIYSNSLVSSYLGRPLYLTSIR